MYGCSNLTHFDGLIPAEKMLACEAPSLQGESLCLLLSEMDKKEWRVLNTEENKLHFKINRLSTSDKIIILFGSFVGSMSVTVPTIFLAPLAAPAVGAASFLGIQKICELKAEQNHNFKEGLFANSERSIRLKEKISNIKWRAAAIKSSSNADNQSSSSTDPHTQSFWSLQTIFNIFRYFFNLMPRQDAPPNKPKIQINNVELMQLNKALIYFSEGSESIDP